MKPDRADKFNWAQGFFSATIGVFVWLCLVLGGSPVTAQSGYSCRPLENYAGLPAVEGRDGVFFRVSPELETYRSFEDESIQKLATLSENLAARGITLVVLPIPTRSLVMPDHLPPLAHHLGYDVDIAVAVYLDMIKRLTAAGITVADPRQPLRRLALDGILPFFGTDPRPTLAGSKAMAKAVAAALAEHPVAGSIARASFDTRAGETVVLPSKMRAQLQIACQSPLPPVETEQAVTTRRTEGGGRIAVVGTEMTGTQVLNFAGYLSEFSGLVGRAYGVREGGAFAAISSYLTSDDFRDRPPHVLVWELSVTTSLARHGDQPLEELIAATNDACTSPLGLIGTGVANRVAADLSALPKDRDITLALDLDGVASPSVRFYFTSEDKQTRVRSIYRHPRQVLTGRFYLPLSGLETTNLERVEIELLSDFGDNPSLHACF